MYVLVYAPSGIVGEEGSMAIVTDTLYGAHYEMYRQVAEYVGENRLDPDDFSLDTFHATAHLCDPSGPEWHIYEA